MYKLSGDSVSALLAHLDLLSGVIVLFTQLELLLLFLLHNLATCISLPLTARELSMSRDIASWRNVHCDICQIIPNWEFQQFHPLLYDLVLSRFTVYSAHLFPTYCYPINPLLSPLYCGVEEYLSIAALQQTSWLMSYRGWSDDILLFNKLLGITTKLVTVIPQ